VRSICGSTVPVILVGCKADLRPPSNDPSIDRYVSREQAEGVAQSIRAPAYKECSALKMEGVDDVFEAATRASIMMREFRVTLMQCDGVVLLTLLEIVRQFMVGGAASFVRIGWLHDADQPR
jgi:Ras family